MAKSFDQLSEENKKIREEIERHSSLLMNEMKIYVEQNYVGPIQPSADHQKTVDQIVLENKLRIEYILRHLASIEIYTRNSAAGIRLELQSLDKSMI